MPDVGGEVKVYVDTRFKGYYVMAAAVKLDTWINGRSYHALDVVCWTPRYPKDTIAKAGERLFRAFLYQMDDVKEGEPPVNYMRIFFGRKMVGAQARD